MRAWWLIVGSVWAATPGVPDVPIEGSAWRMGVPSPTASGQLGVTILHSREACSAVLRDPDEIDACVPRVDPEAGTVRLGIGVTVAGAVSPSLEYSVLRRSRLAFYRGTRSGERS